MQTVEQKIAELKILPVVRLERAEDALPLVRALAGGGIPAAEITFRTACACDAIRAVAAGEPSVLVGAGTVLNARQAGDAVAAGAKFIVSPGLDEELVRFCRKKGVPVFPGCVTATEVQRAVNLGLTTLKFFPAEQAGGLKTIRALSAPFGQVRWMPTGGVNPRNLKEYLSFEKVIACGGSFLTKPRDIAAGNWEGIASLCRETVRLIQSVSAAG